MSTFFTTARRAGLAFSLAATLSLWAINPAAAQTLDTTPVKFNVTGAAERMTITVNTSRIIEFPFEVPKMLVNNPDMVRVVPLSPKSVQISATRSGVTQLNVWDADDKVTTVDVIVIGDVRELEMILKAEFPDASLKLRPLNNALYISGFVPRATDVQQVTTIAQDFFPKVINNMTVGGVQKILLHVKAMEVSRTKLRTLGIDWTYESASGFISQGVSGLISANGQIPTGNQTLNWFVTGPGGDFAMFIEALRKDDLVKLLAEPTLTTISGRAAAFNVGGEQAILVPQQNGAVTIEYKEFGTRVDFVPIVLGNGNLRLEVKAAVSEIDPTLGTVLGGTAVPGFRSRFADTGVEMKTGQTLAIAGLIYNKTEASTQGLPWLSELPWAGAMFRRVSEKNNEVELVIMVTPEYADAMDATDVPPCGPGQLTTSPTDVELYIRAYKEVPKDCKDGSGMIHGGPVNGTINGTGKGYEVVPPGTPSPAAGARRTIGDGQGPVPAARTRALPASSSSHTLSRPQTRTSQSGTETTSGRMQPSLIGPMGYDELK